MKDFLNDYITSLSGKKRTSIYEVLSAARVGKEDLDALSDKLTNIRKQAPIVIAPETFNGRIEATKFDGAYRDIYRRMLEMFQSSNNISLLLDTHSSVLISEIKAIEDELLAMEKAIDNYAFTLSDNGFYDYAFTETFNDDTMFEKDTTIRLTDRSGNDFGLDELASINGSSGILTLNPSLTFSYPLVGHVLNNNCLGLTTSDTGLENSLNASVSNGWRIALASPKPITSSLQNITQQGAQIELELILTAAAPCDTIVLTPFSDIALEILRIQVINGSEDVNITNVLSEATVLDRPLTFNFPLQSVAKFRVVVNQSVYSRGETPPVKEQVVYRDFYSTIKKEREDVAQYMGRDYNKNNKAFKRVFVSSMRQSNKDYAVFKAEVPRIDFDKQHGPMTIDKVVRRKSEFGGQNDLLQYQSKSTTFLRRMMDDKIFTTNNQILNDRQVYNVNTSFIGSPSFKSLNNASQEYPRITGVEAPLSADILSYSTVQESDFLNYQYNLGLRNIQIGTGEQIYRGVFISKQIPAPSGTGEIKLKANDINFQMIDTTKDAKIITSIEYSVANKSTPTVEEDWIPVMPVDSDIVIAERVFINEAGIGYTRFASSPLGQFTLYKNGYKVDYITIRKITNVDNNAIRGVQIPVGTFSGSDIFLADYTPFSNESVINFQNKGFSQSLLASAYDDTGAGETFSSTANNQIVTLLNSPYVYYDSVNAYGSYTSAGFTGTYQPITIVMSDGTIALNQTNYLGNTQNDLSTFDETQTAYIHSNNNIIFNKPITSKFTVYYQYIPSNLRLRIVMRVNDLNYVSPIVNSIQVKAKTLKANARKAV